MCADIGAGDAAALRRLRRGAPAPRTLDVMKSGTAPEGFARQLAETIAWCAPRVDPSRPRECLRSTEVRPDLERHYDTETRLQPLTQVSIALNPRLETEHDRDEWIWLTPPLVAALVQRRTRVLESVGATTAAAALVDRGRLLLSFYEYTDHDGATADLTRGYLDINDVPPWDTWVGDVPCVRSRPPKMKSIHTVMGGDNVDRILVSWVPEPFLAVIDAAMKTEAFGMMAWNDDLPTDERAFGVWHDLVPPWLRDLRPPVASSDRS
jgi:hypothetical protein